MQPVTNQEQPNAAEDRSKFLYKILLASILLFSVLFVGQIFMLTSEKNYIDYYGAGMGIIKVKILEELEPTNREFPPDSFRAKLLKGGKDDLLVGQEIIILTGRPGESEYVQDWRENIGRNVWVARTGNYWGGGVAVSGPPATFWGSKIGTMLLLAIIIDSLLLGFVFTFRKSRFIWLPPTIIFLGLVQLIFFFWGDIYHQFLS